MVELQKINECVLERAELRSMVEKMSTFAVKLSTFIKDEKFLEKMGTATYNKKGEQSFPLEVPNWVLEETTSETKFWLATQK